MQEEKVKELQELIAEASGEMTLGRWKRFEEIVTTMADRLRAKDGATLRRAKAEHKEETMEITSSEYGQLRGIVERIYCLASLGKEAAETGSLNEFVRVLGPLATDLFDFVFEEWPDLRGVQPMWDREANTYRF